MIVCREIDGSEQGQALLMRVTPAPEIYPLKRKKIANNNHLSLRSML